MSQYPTSWGDMSDYLMGGDVLGAFDQMTPEEMKNAPPGWLTPAQLADVDRALTPEEQKLVDDWQIKQANAAQAAEEKKGGPKATAKITKKGATVAAKSKKKAAHDPFPEFEEAATIIEAPTDEAPWSPPDAPGAMTTETKIGMALAAAAIVLGLGGIYFAFQAKWLATVLSLAAGGGAAATAVVMTTNPKTEA